MERDMPSERRQAGAEIEVTPKMIQAGADTLMSFALPDGGEKEWKAAAAAAYEAMENARRAQAPLVSEA
jgi:arabinogalactan endo-1,4-beta-galactosidase